MWEGICRSSALWEEALVLASTERRPGLLQSGQLGLKEDS